MTRRVFCFGASNTYGYDPRSPFGEPYPASVRWTDRLAASTGMNVINAGMNGQKIPYSASTIQAVCQMISDNLPLDLLLIMLGTNDLLSMPNPSSETVAQRMADFIHQIQLFCPDLPVLVIAPPLIRLPDCPEVTRQSSHLADALRAAVSNSPRVFLADASQWPLTLCYDGVHFTEDAHAVFSSYISTVLEQLEPF